MPRYFFHSEGSQLKIDEEGTDLPALDAARLEAIQTAGEMLRDGAINAEAPDGLPWRLWVTEGPGAAGATLLSVHIFIQSKPPQAVPLTSRMILH